MNKTLSVLTILLLMLPNTLSFGKGHTVTSSAFDPNGSIPTKYTCEGQDVNPPLHLSGVPKNAKSIALILHDPDAPMKGGFTHWVMWNIETSVTELPEQFMGASQGLNSAKKTGYIGMCPPNGTHHYQFSVYALDTKLDLPKTTNKEELERAMKGHIIDQAELVGLYKKLNK